jgi:hypothetical protein
MKYLHSFLTLFFDSKRMNNIGNMNNVKSVAENNPPMTTVANGLCTSAPEPLLKAIGKNPSDATHAVMSTGLKRIFVPINTILIRFFIPDSCKRTNSATSTIPFKTATPNSAMKPTPALILKGIPRIDRKNTPPMADKGMAE